jgi:hypothetical protein
MKLLSIIKIYIVVKNFAMTDESTGTARVLSLIVLKKFIFDLSHRRALPTARVSDLFKGALL